MIMNLESGPENYGTQICKSLNIFLPFYPTSRYSSTWTISANKLNYYYYFQITPMDVMNDGCMKWANGNSNNVINIDPSPK